MGISFVCTFVEVNRTIERTLVERRSALITLAGAVGGLINLPTWASGWTAETVQSRRYPTLRDQNELLAEIVETIIPVTDTPGAKALNVHQFIQKMVTDCFDKPAQELFAKGIVLTDELAQKSFGKSFSAGDTTQRTALLTQMSQSADSVQKDFYSMVKNLTIRGYMNSEYVMTNLMHFEFIPGRYHGCVPVVAKAVTPAPIK